MSKLNLTKKELRVLTWIDDVDGMDNKIEGDNLVIFYTADPKFWELKLSLTDASKTIHDIYDIEEDKLNLN